MKIAIDTDARRLEVDGQALPLYGDDAFRILCGLWLKVGWNQKYSYTMSWQGVPMTFHDYVVTSTLEGSQQAVLQGPVAALEIIKNLGTNGEDFSTRTERIRKRTPRR